MLDNNKEPRPHSFRFMLLEMSGQNIPISYEWDCSGYFLNNFIFTLNVDSLCGGSQLCLEKKGKDFVYCLHCGQSQVSKRHEIWEGWGYTGNSRGHWTHSDMPLLPMLKSWWEWESALIRRAIVYKAPLRISLPLSFLVLLLLFSPFPFPSYSHASGYH